jgi:polar amino acid transport system substrate-binding protein
VTRRALLFAVVAVLASVSAAVAHCAPSQLPTLQLGRLTVALSMPSPGFQTGAVRGRQVVLAKGFEVDLMKAIARKLGIKHVDFVNERKFASLYAAGKKPWDLAVAEVTITPARSANVDFSIPYLNADAGVLVRNGLSIQPRSIADLRGLRLCSERGTTSADLIANTIRPERKPSLLTTANLLLQRVQTGACDAAVYDLPILATLRALAPDRYGPLVGRIVTGEQYGLVFPKGSPLRPLVDEALQALLAGPTVNSLERKWLKLDPGKLRVLASL